jgi:hypothetical protein
VKPGAGGLMLMLMAADVMSVITGVIWLSSRRFSSLDFVAGLLLLFRFFFLFNWFLESTTLLRNWVEGAKAKQSKEGRGISWKS